MKIQFECDITDWATPEDFATMTDTEIEDMAREDLTSALEFATVRIIDDPDVIKARAAALYKNRTE